MKQYWAKLINEKPIEPKLPAVKIDKVEYLKEVIKNRNASGLKETTLKVRMHSGTFRTLNLTKLYQYNKKYKEDIINTFLNGDLTLNKTLSISKDLKKPEITQQHIFKKLNQFERDTICIAIAKIGIKNEISNIDWTNNRISMDNQTSKLSKVLRKELVQYYPEDSVDEILQKISAVWNKGANNKTIHYTWTVDPAYFIRQSDDAVRSCHAEEYNGYLGRPSNSSLPWVTQAVDSVTTMLFTFDENNKVASRLAIYINTVDKTFSFGRSYPENVFANGGLATILIDIRKTMKKKKYTEKHMNELISFGESERVIIPKNVRAANKTTWTSGTPNSNLPRAYLDFKVERTSETKHNTIYAQQDRLNALFT